ncbi:hypothetical protein [Mycolicibacter sinensis]|jgi:hypothetical protein|uniref:hypothetical protein n=1 Tax=Mycolicibacter sinensis (strain JDM601) TaxID=875328 RepID=UPI000AA0FF06|nr:hypothetical protein [Mycolicibacter sinensis]
MDISTEDVRRLLGTSETDDPVLILIEGRLEIVPAAELTSAKPAAANRCRSGNSTTRR